MTREAIAKELIGGIQKYLRSIKMEKELKVGDKVRIRDCAELNRNQIPYAGKKGKVVEYKKPIAIIRFKDGEDLDFYTYKLEFTPKQPKLLPFNLDEALAGKAVVTRDGREVNNIRVKNADKDLVGMITGIGPFLFGRNGVNKNGTISGTESDPRYDLFMKPEPKKKKTYWVNVLKESDSFATQTVMSKTLYPSRETAIRSEDGEKNIFKTIKIKL